MDTKKIMTLLGSVLTVTAGVLIAFQVQSYLNKQTVLPPDVEE